MTNIETQTNSIDQLQLLEHRLRQDILAQKKILKWAKTIETRIERTRSQLEKLKQQKQNTTKNTIQLRTSSKIPIPSRLVQNTLQMQQQQNKSIILKSMSNNRAQESETNEKVNVELKIKQIKLKSSPDTERTKTKRITNNTQSNQEKSFNFILSSYITNLIDAYIQKRFGPISKRLENLELQLDSNEHSIQEVKSNITTFSKISNDNAKEYENSLNNIKNILINYYSKNVT